MSEAPGVLAVTTRAASPATQDLRAVLAGVGIESAATYEGPGLVVITWGAALGADGSLLLSRGPRRHEHDLSPAEVSTMLEGPPTPLAEVLPPFAAVRRTAPGELVATTDALGFRQLYWTCRAGTAALSTSARALAALTGAGLDRDSVSLQSLLGWQVGHWTLHDGVSKLGAGSRVRLAQGRMSVEDTRPGRPAPLDLEDGVRAAATMLREHLGAYVADHPDATLQLTGGQDSRILLSAVPPDLRRGLRAFTLGGPRSADVAVAARVAARAGVDHRVEDLGSLEALDPREALDLCARSSARLEGMADPVALAALTMAERRIDQGHRIAGLGGEVARGFYYLGSGRDRPVTRARVARLTSWRMFANEAVDPAALSADLREGARERAVDRIHTLMADTGLAWLEATDAFYLDQRMQRWAGVTDTAVCQDRAVVNPMLDDRFVAIARALAPRSKRSSLFLARLQMALDPDLGRMALEGRPPPEAYARPGLVNRARAVRTLGQKAVAKAEQRLGRSTRPPAGGTVLAAKVVQAWRDDPCLLDPARRPDVLDDGWLTDLVAGKVDPDPSTVAFVLNLAGLPVGSRALA